LHHLVPLQKKKYILKFDLSSISIHSWRSFVEEKPTNEHKLHVNWHLIRFMVCILQRA
jgi:hypothetical protein